MNHCNARLYIFKHQVVFRSDVAEVALNHLETYTHTSMPQAKKPPAGEELKMQRIRKLRKNDYKSAKPRSQKAKKPGPRRPGLPQMQLWPISWRGPGHDRGAQVFGASGQSRDLRHGMAHFRTEWIGRNKSKLFCLLKRSQTSRSPGTQGGRNEPKTSLSKGVF